MNRLGILLGLWLGLSLQVFGLQAGTPQAALEEIATTDKPEVLARHLPEVVQKSIEVLPNPQKREVLNKLLDIKAEQMEGCTVRRASGIDSWEIVNQQGESTGKVKLASTFITGLESLLSLRVESNGNSQMVIVAMHLEGDDWRLDSLGAWENTDLGLRKLVHQPTELEKNETSAQETLRTISNALSSYAQRFPHIGYPTALRALTGAGNEESSEEQAGLLEASFAGEPVTRNGYEFRYLLTRRGNLRFMLGSIPIGDRGGFQIVATPIQFGKTGSRNYLATENGIHITTDNRDATEEDPVVQDPD